MTRQEFIHKLQASLTGKVSSAKAAESFAFYEEYFDTEIRNGKTQEEVIAKLGDPHLIAISIIEAEKHKEISENYEEFYSGSDKYTEDGAKKKNFLEWMNERPKWLQIVMIVLVSALVIYLAALFLRAFLPIIIVIVFVVFMVRIIQNLKR